jgi:hypothetical protein
MHRTIPVKRIAASQYQSLGKGAGQGLLNLTPISLAPNDAEMPQRQRCASKSPKEAVKAS